MSQLIHTLVINIEIQYGARFLQLMSCQLIKAGICFTVLHRLVKVSITHRHYARLNYALEI